MATKDKGGMDEKISEVMSLMAQRSVEARRKKWGKREFARKLRKWGKLGGRPRKSKMEDK